MKRTIAAFAIVALLLAPGYAASGADEITPGDISSAEARRSAVAAELADTTARYDAAVARSVEIRDQLGILAAELALAESTLSELRIEAADVTRAMYMEAGVSAGATVFDADTINEIPVREGYLGRLTGDGAQTLARFEAVEAAHAEQSRRLEELSSEQEETVADLEELADEILATLQSADAEYQALVVAFEAQEEARRRAEEEARRRREEEERRAATSTTAAPTTTTVPGEVTTTTTGDGDGDGDGGGTTTTTAPPTTTTAPPPADPPPPTGGRVCPVNGAVSFTDTWGASRSGGRSHKGVDMIAARGTPVVAIESGSVRTSNSSLGGLSIYLSGSSGDTFYYAHLDSYVVTSGSVSTGQLIGTVGNTGNAQYTVPHLHFEHHPGGGGAVNPTPLVSGLC